MLSAEARDVDTSTPRTLIQQATAIGAFGVWVQIGSIRLAWALWKALRE